MPEKRDIHSLVAQAVQESATDAGLYASIENLANTLGEEVYSTLLMVLASVDMPSQEAKELWARSMEHASTLSHFLRRPVGILVALLDLLTNIEQHLQRSKIIELDTFEKLAVSAVTDGLTGLYNSTFFWSELEKEVAKAKRYGSFGSVIIFDLDDFKSFNDSYGHLNGDTALQGLASIMRANSRKVDLLARYGGEEFIVILPMTKIKGALVVAERIRQAMETFEVPLSHSSNQYGRITVSGGIALFPNHGKYSSAEEVVERADRSLYRAKATGKNRILVDS